MPRSESTDQASVQRLMGVLRVWCGGASSHLLLPPPPPHLRHDTEDGVVAADARADLLVVLLCVAHLVELRLKTHTNGPLPLPCFLIM